MQGHLYKCNKGHYFRLRGKKKPMVMCLCGENALPIREMEKLDHNRLMRGW